MFACLIDSVRALSALWASGPTLRAFSERQDIYGLLAPEFIPCQLEESGKMCLDVVAAVNL